MGFRFRKSVSFGRLVRLNISGSGVSLGLAWLKGRSMARAFEVKQHNVQIFSGLLRMADLLAL